MVVIHPTDIYQHSLKFLLLYIIKLSHEFIFT